MIQEYSKNAYVVMLCLNLSPKGEVLLFCVGRNALPQGSLNIFLELSQTPFVKPESKSPIPCPNRPQILTLRSDQV